MELSCCLRRFKMDKIASDSFSWRCSNDRIFSTKSMYNALSKEFFEEETMDTVVLKLWCKSDPSKVFSFLWKAFWNRIPTRENLVKRRVALDNPDSFYAFCSYHVEDIDHLFCSCKFTYDVWQKCRCWLEVHGVGSNNFRNHLSNLFGFLKERWVRSSWPLFGNAFVGAFRRLEMLLFLKVLLRMWTMSWMVSDFSRGSGFDHFSLLVLDCLFIIDALVRWCMLRHLSNDDLLSL